MEKDLVALPDNCQRYELVEGSLIVSPPPAFRHQVVSFQLAMKLQAAIPSQLLIAEAVGVRLLDGSMFIPDVLVAEAEAGWADRSGILDAGVVRLVVEVVSPGSTSRDRLLKPSMYAAAGVPAFWRVETVDDDDLRIVAYALEGTVYREVDSARSGEVLALDQPFPIVIEVPSVRPVED